MAFDVKGNTVLSALEVERAIYPFMGPGKTPEDVEAARAALQSIYETKGFPTVSVFVPDQSVETGVIRLEVAEQRIGQVTVAGARYFDPEDVRAGAPSLAEGAVPNFEAVQRDIVALNQLADRQVTPELTPGAAPGTVDVVLNVEDDLPLHGSIEVNNRGSAQTTDLRVSASVRYDNLWGRGDSIGLSAQTAPQRTDDGTVFSGNYLTRLPWRNLLLTAYAVHSESDIAVVGDINVVGAGDLIGVRVVAPLPSGEGFYQSATAGFDYKNFDENVTLGADRDSVPIEYWPFILGWRGDWIGETVQSDLSFNTIFGFRGLGDPLISFDRKRFNAKPNFFYVRGEGGQTVTYANDLQLSAKFTAQWSGEPLISNEQFSLGGLDTVRGFFESEALGDYGFAAQAEIRSPQLASRLSGEGGLIDDLRLHVFADAGFAGIHDALPGQDEGYLLAAAGIGARIRLYDYVNGSVDVAVPTVSGPNKDRGDAIIRFRLWGEF